MCKNSEHRTTAVSNVGHLCCSSVCASCVRLEYDFRAVCNQRNYSSRDTEYYDYGHGEAQETYEAYGMSGDTVLLQGRGCT